MITRTDLQQMLEDAQRQKGGTQDPEEKQRLEDECQMLRDQLQEMGW